MPADPALTRLLAHAKNQHGVFSRRQAFDAGLTRSAIDWRIATGEWVSVDTGIYRGAATPTSWRQRLLAACLAGPAVASHRAAAAVWGFPGFQDAPVEVSATRHLRRYASDVVWHESRHLGERSVTAIDAIPITGAARTIVDLGSVVDEASVVAALDDALRRMLVTTALVTDTLDRFGPRRRGAGVVRRALKRRSDANPIPESVLESRFEQVLVDYGLPAPVRQYEVHDRQGALIARVDFAFPDARLAIEVDSVRYHAGADDWRRDLDRQNRLIAIGWQVVRFTANDINVRPGWIARVVLGALRDDVRS